MTSALIRARVQSEMTTPIAMRRRVARTKVEIAKVVVKGDVGVP